MKKKTTEQALNLLFEVQGNKYSYPNFEYLKNDQMIEVLCEKHGLFSIRYNSMVSRTKPQGCPRCGIEKRVQKTMSYFNKVEFLDKVKFHDGKFNYDHIQFPVTLKTVLTLNCLEHGQFNQTVLNHFKSDCEKCSYKKRGKNRSKGLDSFIKDSKLIFGNDQFDYSEFVYINNKTHR